MRAMMILAIGLLVLGTIAAPFSEASSPEETGISKSIPEAQAPSVVLVESFLGPQAERVGESAEGVQLTWWPWSDETGSNWPDDDAKARIGQLGLSGEAGTLYNGQIDLQTASAMQFQTPLIDLEGTIELVREETGDVSLSIAVELTPLVNLSDSTVVSILISEDRSMDHHGRVAEHLVRDMMPQVGFSVDANNLTKTTWKVPSTHLAAAGIDFEEQPHGWHITFAFFGDLEGGEENRLLGLYHTSAPTSWDSTAPSDFFVPMFLLLLCAVVASGAVMGSFKREKGMPKIDAQWTSSEPPSIQFRILAGTQPLSLTGCTTVEPWAIRGGFKRVSIPAGRSHEFAIRFKQAEPEDCHISLSVEVEELGAWTQYLRLASPQEALRSVEVGEHEPSNGDDA